MGRLPSLTMRWRHLSFDLQGAFLCMCSREGLLDFKNEEYVVFYLLSGQDLASPPSCYFGGSVHRGWTPAAQPGAHLSPAPNPPERSKPWEIFIGRVKGKCLSSVASSGCLGACRPYLVGVTELSPCLIKGWLLLLFQQDMFQGVAGISASLSSCLGNHCVLRKNKLNK